MNASRAVDSQQTLVAVPVMITVSMPAACSRSPRSLEPWISALKRRLMTCSVARLDVELVPERGAVRTLGQRAQHVAQKLRRQELHVGRPGARSIVAVDRPDPPHRAAGIAHRRRQPVDVGHDGLAIRRVGGHPLFYPDVLHVDDDQGRLRRVQPIDRVQLAAAPFCHPGNHVGRKLDLVHLGHFDILVGEPGNRISGQVMSDWNDRTAGMGSMHRLRILITLLSLVCFGVSPASAQNSFPSKPITMLVPFGAGGALDLIARVLADGLRNELGQTITRRQQAGRKRAACHAARRGGGAGRLHHHLVKRKQPHPASALGRQVFDGCGQGIRPNLAVGPIPAHADREKGASRLVGQGIGGVPSRQSG